MNDRRGSMAGIRSFSWFVARRYLTAQRRQAFIGVISAFSIVGVGVGVAAVIVALALMTGVQGEMRDRILGSTGHIYITPFGVLDAWDVERPRFALPGVVGVAPAATGAAFYSSGTTRGVGGILKGIDPAAEATVVDLRAALREGSLDGLTPSDSADREGIVLGVDLANALGVRVGDLVDVRTAAVSATPAGLVPRMRPLRVVGTFAFGFYDVDNQFGLVSLTTAMSLLRLDQPNVVQLKLADPDRAPAFKADLEQKLGSSFQVQDWSELNASLYAALWLEKVAIALAVGLIVMVAALNIVASLVLLVMEKTRDIAILRTLGTSAATIRRIFVLQGLTIGLVGTGAGVALGVGISLVADRWRLITMPSEVYHISHLPFRVTPLDVAIVAMAAVLICLTATIYPSWRAGRIDPAEGLRHQ